MKSDFTIKNHNIHLWRVHLIDFSTQENDFLMLLSPDELQRANRFRFPEHRQRFIIARGMLRQILGLYTHFSPAEIIFSYGVHGKPFLQENRLNVKFNVSHSNDMAVYALTHEFEVGVDIQKIEEKYKEAVAK